VAARGCRRRAKRRRIAGVSRKRDSGRVWLGFWVEEHAPDAVNTTAGLARGADMAGSGAALRRASPDGAERERGRERVEENPHLNAKLRAGSNS